MQTRSPLLGRPALCVLAPWLLLACLDRDPDPLSEVDSGPPCTGCAPVPRLDFERVPLSDAPEQATSFVFSADGSELFVALKAGSIHRYRPGADGYERVGAFALDEVWSENDCGLESITLDPDFVQNRFLYAAGCIAHTANRLWRVQVDPSNDSVTSASAVTILTVEEPQAPRPFHNAGSLLFDADGYLFALFGDKVRGANGQDLTDLLGAVLRIDPSRDPEVGGAAPAPGNPFVDDPDAMPEVYAYGLRMPWRASLDRQGRLWVGDIGSDKFEEVNVVTAPGMNFGWNVAEGPCANGCESFVDPIVSWNRDTDHAYLLDDADSADSTGRAVWVGPVYDGRPSDRYDGMLSDRVLYGEFCTGFVRVLEVDDDLNVKLDAHVAHLETPVQWQQAHDGYLYVLTFGTTGSVIEDPPESLFYRVVLAED